MAIENKRRAALDRRAQRRYRLAFVASAMLMLGIIVTLPFSLAGVATEVLGPVPARSSRCSASRRRR